MPSPILADPRLQAYVDGVGQRLAAQSHRANLKWTFTVLDSPEVNAFALPGGYVYITRGILAYLDSEAELAGVVGHEIGHITAPHGAQRATRQQNAGLGVLAASVLGMVLESRGVGGAADSRASSRKASPPGTWRSTAANRSPKPTGSVPNTSPGFASIRRTWSTSSAC